MARNIDERIVQMTFNNQQFEHNANQTISTLDKLKNALNFSGAEKSLDGIDKATKGLDLSSISVAAYKVSESFNALEAIAFGALTRIGQQAVDTGIKLAKSLSIDQISSGWNKYNEQTQSVQTLVNSTGKSVEEIDGYLEKLMWYSDETSFGFTDMTKALATMVSSGGEIDNLIPMIMGIGNATAYAGKSASEFQRVIYNLNQSYSSGYLQTMDWRSLELAGADSKALKMELIGAAEALGLIKEGVYGLEDFKDLLSDKVFTRDVMEKAFGSFAEMTLEAERLVSTGQFKTAADAIEHLSGKYSELAERSFLAAQEAKSFSEAIEATKDAVSSGWMQTFKLIFGNYTESKALWTDVTETFWEIFASGAESRNDLLKEWKSIWSDPEKRIELLGKAESDRIEKFEVEYGVLTQIHGIWRAIHEVIMSLRDTVSDVFAEVFDPVTAEGLFLFIEKIRNGIWSIYDYVSQNANETSFTSIVRGFEGLLVVVRAATEIVKEFFNSFIGPLTEKLKPIIEDLLAIFGNIGDVLYSKGFDLINDMSPVQKIFESILKVLDPLINGLGKVVKYIKEFSDAWKKNRVFDDTEKVSLFSKAIDLVSNAFITLCDVLGNLGKFISPVIKQIKELIKNAKEFLVNPIGETGVNPLGIAGLLLGLKKIFDIKLDFKKVIDKVFEPLKKIGEKVNEVLDSFKNSIDAVAFHAYVSSFKQIAISLLIFAGALFIIASIDEKALTKATLVLGGLIGACLFIIKEFSKIKGSKLKNIANIATVTGAIIGIGYAMIEMAIALKILSTIKPEQMTTTLILLGGTLAAIMLFIGGINKMTKGVRDVKIATLAAFMKSLGFALLELSVALKILSTINPQQMTTTLTLLGGTLTALMIFIGAINKLTKGMKETKLATLGAFMTSVGFALLELSAALKIISTINPSQVTTTMILLVGTLGAIALFIAATNALTKGMRDTKLATLGAFMTTMGLALIGLSVGLKILSSIDAKSMGVALLGLVGLLSTIMLLAAVVSTTGGKSFMAAAAGLLVISAALAILSVSIIALGKVGWETIGSGLLALGIALGGIVLYGALLGVVSPLFAAFAIALGIFGVALLSVSKGILAFSAAYAVFEASGTQFAAALCNLFEQATAALIAALPMFIAAIIDAVLLTADKILELVNKLLDILIKAVTESLPRIIQLGFDILIALLTGIRDNIKEVVVLAFEILHEFITGLREGLPQFLDDLVKFFIDAINGLADAIRDNAGDLGAAFGNLASAIITGLIAGLMALIGTFAGGLIKFIGDAINSIGQENDTGKDEGISTGENISEGVKQGIENKKNEIIKAAELLGQQAAEAMDKSAEALVSGQNTGQGFIDGLRTYIETAYSTGYSIGAAAVEGMNAGADVHSPSRKAMKSGKYIGEGLIIGLQDMRTRVINAGYDTGSSLVKAIDMALEIANRLMEEQMNPVITPVLDLSNIENNSGKISELLGNTSFNSAMSINGALAQGTNQNGESNKVSPNINIDFTINKAGGELSEFDINKYGKMISDRVNIELGKLLS